MSNLLTFSDVDSRSVLHPTGLVQSTHKEFMEPPMSVTIVEDISVQDVQKRKRPSKHYVFIIDVRWQDSGVIPVYRSYSSVLKLQDKLMRIRDFLSNMKDARGRTKTGALLREESFFARFTLRKKKQAQRRLGQVDDFLKSVVQLPAYISQSDPVINFFRPLDEDLAAPESTARINVNEDRELLKSKDDRHSSNPKLLEQYVAISNYTKQEEKDLDLEVGNVVDVIERNEHGWWFVDLEGALGWVPASLLEPRDRSADDVVMETFIEGEEETYIAVETYQAKEEGEIGFSVDCVVEVTQKNVDGWWRIRIQGEEGWAPAMFLEEAGTSSRERLQTSIRRMNRGGLRNSISRVAGRRNTKEPPPKRQHTELKQVSSLLCSRAGADERTESTDLDAATPAANLGKLCQEIQNELHASEPRQNVESNDECTDVVLEQEKERNGREKSAGKDGLVMFEHGRQNEFNEASSSKESDSSKPESPVLENTPLKFSCDFVDNPEIESEGSVSEDPEESGDECSDQEVFLEGPVLTDERADHLHRAPVCKARSADRNVQCTLGSHQKVTDFGVSPRNTSQGEELKEFKDDPWLVQNVECSDRELFGGMGDLLANPLGMKAVVKSTTHSSNITQQTLLKSTDTGLLLTGGASNRQSALETCCVGVQGSCDAIEQEGLGRAEIDRAVMTQKREEVKGPSLAVAEDLDDLDDFME